MLLFLQYNKLNSCLYKHLTYENYISCPPRCASDTRCHYFFGELDCDYGTLKLFFHMVNKYHSGNSHSIEVFRWTHGWSCCYLWWHLRHYFLFWLMILLLQRWSYLLHHVLGLLWSSSFWIKLCLNTCVRYFLYWGYSMLLFKHV